MVVVMEGVGRPHRNALFVNGSILGWTHNRKVGGLQTNRGRNKRKRG